MPQDGDNTMIRPLARQGRDGMAILGLNRFDVAGIRFEDGEDGANPTTGQDDTTDDEQDSADDDEATEQGEGADDDGFEGEFDAKRARSLITKLRDQLKQQREAGKPKDSPTTAKLQDENLRLRVALSVGLDEDLADRLRGSTREELLEDAQKLVDRLSPQKLEDRTPKPKLRGGTTPDKEPEVSSDDVAKAILGR